MLSLRDVEDLMFELGSVTNENRSPHPDASAGHISAIHDVWVGAYNRDANLGLRMAQIPMIADSYSELKGVLLGQYRILQEFGISFEFVDEDPYKTSTQMFNDLWNQSKIKVFTGGVMGCWHPLSELLEERGDNFVTYNSIFRAVHDVVGHGLRRLPFSHGGEFAAWKVHRDTFRVKHPAACLALALETRCQNAWYNYDGGGDLRPKSERRFSPQIIYPVGRRYV
jgi:hypothetical protein